MGPDLRDPAHRVQLLGEPMSDQAIVEIMTQALLTAAKMHVALEGK